MKLTTRLLIVAVVSQITLVSCADYEKLESIEVTPVIADASDDAANDLYVCKTTTSNGNGLRQFQVIGHYSDDSTETLTKDSKWTTDASHDSYLPTTNPGTVLCPSAYGIFGIKATYSENAGESDSTDTDESVDFTDSVLVKAQ